VRGWTRRAAVPLIGSALLVTLPGGALAASGVIDVEGDPHIAWLAEHGITRGCGDGTSFCGEEAVTRRQAAAFLYRLAQARVVDAGTVGGYTAGELRGRTGPAGLAGERGAAGPQGERGAPGPKGDSGVAGVPGAAGAVGTLGPKGEAGAVGPQGAQGPKGDAGAQGAPGLPGAQGATGVDGAQGPKGDTGAAGAQGPKGDTGAIGPHGPQGDIGLTGPQGAKGDTGPAGPQGAQGAKGDTGLQGDTGATGPQGPQGIQGPVGPAATLTTARREAGPVGIADGDAVYPAHCLATERVLGGGYLLTGTLDNKLASSAEVTGSGPSLSSTAWEVHVRGAGGLGANGTIVTYAVCAPGTGI
jgi:hypothetical protein